MGLGFVEGDGIHDGKVYGANSEKRPFCSSHQSIKFYFIEFCIDIEDTGIGISEEGMQKLFLNFSSLKEHKEVNKSGTGLGLSICKQIIGTMGGNINVTSKMGSGTTFKIELSTVCTLKADQIN